MQDLLIFRHIIIIYQTLSTTLHSRIYSKLQNAGILQIGCPLFPVLGSQSSHFIINNDRIVVIKFLQKIIRTTERNFLIAQYTIRNHLCHFLRGDFTHIRTGVKGLIETGIHIFSQRRPNRIITSRKQQAPLILQIGVTIIMFDRISISINDIYSEPIDIQYNSLRTCSISSLRNRDVRFFFRLQLQIQQTDINRIFNIRNIFLTKNFLFHLTRKKNRKK